MKTYLAISLFLGAITLFASRHDMTEFAGHVRLLISGGMILIGVWMCLQ